MADCSACGASIEKGSVFCASCGTGVSRSMGRFALWFAITLAAVAGVVGLLLLVSGGNTQEVGTGSGSGPFTIDSRDDGGSSSRTTAPPPTSTTTRGPASTTSTAAAGGSVVTSSTAVVPSEVEADTKVILDWYRGWTDAALLGRQAVEQYVEGHLYPGLPGCSPGEIDYVSVYTPIPETISRVDDWAITWGPLNGVVPTGRVYEVQLAERLEEGPSHVTIIGDEPYVFYNCG